MERYARYRAPDESGQMLIDPPWTEMGGTLAANAQWRSRADLEILGQSLADFTAAARGELLARAAEYVGAYHAGGGGAIDVAKPIIFTGHQPELVHPGVWLKNFAAAALAEEHDATAIHLIIDADACRHTAIRVPTGHAGAPRFETVEFDRRAPEMPWEERPIIDFDCWHSFGERVRKTTSPPLAERFLDEWWPAAVARGRSTHRVGAALAEARHLAEVGWGRRNLELPQSQMCQTTAFRRFVFHLLEHLPRFVEAYNGALAEYRGQHGLRNHAQPAPDLVVESPWLEAPLWMWSTAVPRRRPVFVRPQGKALVVSDRQTFERPLPPDAADAVTELTRWEAAGVKVRSRALITTMFTRLAVADLFIHGIGGAKYDEATDAVCERFFGAAPPRFAVLSGTLRLPIEHSSAPKGNLSTLRQQLRTIEFHPERIVNLNDSFSGDRSLAAGLMAQKRRWIDTPKTAANAASRHQAIAAANSALQPIVAADRVKAEQQLARAVDGLRASRILNSREYAFCLFPRRRLEQFLLDFPEQAL